METNIWQPTLENELVLLRPLQRSDYEELYLVASDPLIWEQHPVYSRHKREEYDLFFEESLDTGMSLVIIDKRTNKIFGSTRYYDYDEKNSSVKIGGTFLDRAHWGGSYNFSIKELVLEYAFRFVNKIIFEIAEENIRSQKASSRFGVEEKEHFMKEIHGKEYPYINYELTPELWAHAKRMRA
jgi:RimJ/RimL family protein N-acetyltransferase